jgi:hypothetical protein
MPIFVPSDYHAALRRLAGLSPEASKSLADRLAADRARAHPRGYIPAITEVTDLTRDEADDLLQALAGLYIRRLRYDMDAPEFATEVCETLEATFNSAAELATLRQTLGSLLALDDTLGVASKALDLVLSAPHSFCGAPRVLTDVRPVFHERDADELAGGLVMHHLVIKYHEAGEQREMQFMLDSTDLVILSGVLERASEKERTLRDTLSGTPMRVLGEDDS